MKTQIFSSLSLLVLAAACSPTNPVKTNPPVEYSKLTEVGKIQADTTPKVDVLFVMDNAQMMAAHQQKLSDNIDKFAESFKASAGNLDFHIGVISIFDRSRFKKGQPGCDFDNGQLRPIKTLAPGGKDPAIVPGRNFVTNKDDSSAYLKQTLKLGEQPFNLCGAQYEEAFAPVEAALSQPMLSHENKDFYRSDANLAVIFVSDADDESQDISASQMAEFLLNLKSGNRDKISVYAVTTPISDMSCPRDTDGPPLKLMDLVDELQGTFLNLCDPNYGAKLGTIGLEIGQKASITVIELAQQPEFSTLQVQAGDTVLPNDHDTGWVYDATRKAIIISGRVMLGLKASTHVTIDYTPIDMRNSANPQRVHIVH